MDKVQRYILSKLFLIVAFGVFQWSAAQCVDNSIRPSDTFSIEAWSPRCHNGTDAEIHVFNIASSAGNTLTNQNYAVRILTGPNAPMEFTIPTNATDYTITGLQAGNYTIDIIDACGGNSADKNVTINNPFSHINTTIVLKDKFTETTNSVCGSILNFKVSMVTSGTSGDATYTFTNNLGETLTFTRLIPRRRVADYYSYSLDAEIPETFFNNAPITYTCSNLCGIAGQGTVQKPNEHSMVWGQPNIMDAQDPNNPCNIGYDVKIFRNYMTNPITVTVEETNNPGVTPLNFFGNPISPQTVNLIHLNAVAIGSATPINLGLKYNTNYTLYFTDACGLTFTETIIKESVNFEPSLVCGINVAVVDPGGFFDDISIVRFDALPLSSLAVGPLQVTVNSGPSTYTSTSGSGQTITSATINYPYSFQINSPFETINVLKDNIRAFPPGNYNFTITDNCNKSFTFNKEMGCLRNSTITHQLNTCANVSNLVNTSIRIPRAMLGSRASIYKADGTLVLTGPISTSAPFNFVLLTGGAYGNLNIDLPNNETYYFRYGGVAGNGTIAEPTQFGGQSALPRLVDGYLYEYLFEVQLAPFQFTSINACGNEVEMAVTGGTAPYNFTLLDSTGAVQLFPNQASASFTGLQTGVTYIAKVIDSCGREFSQEFNVLSKPNPIVQNITQPICNTSTGSVSLSNLPNHWTITDNNNNITITGTETNATIENLNPGIYNLVCIDTVTQCTSETPLTFEILPIIPCPIAEDDTVLFNSGETTIVNVLANDTTGATIVPSSIRIADISNSTIIETDNNNEIVSLQINNEGIWNVDTAIGEIEFNPFPSFQGTPSSISYYGKDNYGNISNSATVILDLLPIAVNDSTNFENGITNTISVLDNDNLGDLVDPTTVSFVIPQNTNGLTYITNATTAITELTVANEGTWSVCPNTGAISFVPEPNFNGIPSEKFYNVKDTQGNVSNNAKITFSPTCNTNVSCFMESNIEVQCLTEIPNESNVSISDFLLLGGNITGNQCGIIIITAENSTFNGCNTEIIRTYTITEYQDNNQNGTLDADENTVNSSFTCSQVYKINDTIAPQFNENLPIDKIVSCNQITNAEVLTATDNCSTATVNFSESIENGDCPNHYFIVRNWIAIDACGNEANHTQIITVQDNEAPTLIGTINDNITISSSEVIPVHPNLTFEDNCSEVNVQFNEEITQGDCENSYLIIRTWKAADACNNETIINQTITVQDNTTPQFTSELPKDTTSSCDQLTEAPMLNAIDGNEEVTVVFEEEKIEGNCNSRYVIKRTWKAIDSCGNSSTYTQTINLICDINVYNALSPNEDGQNDIFLLEGIECFPNNSVEIFNRWGAKVYETSNYDNRSNVFNGISNGKGTVSQSEKLPTGTYFYVLNYQYSLEDTNTLENVQKTGYLYIVNN